MGLLNRDQILDADDAEFEDVPVPEWGGEVRVKALTGDERDAFEASNLIRRTVRGPKGRGEKIDVQYNSVGVRARLVAVCVIGEDGKPLFSEDDVHALGSKSARALNRVVEVSQRLSGLTDEDIEELAQDLAPAQNESSTTDLHSLLGEPSESS